MIPVCDLAPFSSIVGLVWKLLHLFYGGARNTRNSDLLLQFFLAIRAFFVP